MPKKPSPIQVPHHITHEAPHHEAVDQSKRLGHVSESPPWLRQPFINHGYRLNFSLVESLLSVLIIHNETLNIWTHALPALWWLSQAVEGILGWISGELPLLLTFARVLYPISAATTLASSALFHTCNCVSHSHHQQMRTLDFVGISALVMGSTWSVMHYAFRCSPVSWGIYAVICSVLSIAGVVIPFVPLFHRDSFRIFRIGSHCASALGPLVMGFHAWIAFGFDSLMVQYMFSRILLGYIFYALGVVFYACRVPERWLPGRFDFIGASHQFWHLLVVAGSWALHSGLVNYMEVAKDALCPI